MTKSKVLRLIYSFNIIDRREKNGVNDYTGSIINLDLIVSKQLANTYIISANSLNLHNLFLCFEKKNDMYCKNGYKTDRAANLLLFSLSISSEINIISKHDFPSFFSNQIVRRNNISIVVHLFLLYNYIGNDTA